MKEEGVESRWKRTVSLVDSIKRGGKKRGDEDEEKVTRGADRQEVGKMEGAER